MRSILIAGGLNREDNIADQQKALGQLLARAVIAKGHRLIVACLNEFDYVVASAALEEAERGGLDPSLVIQSFAFPNQPPTHQIGDVRWTRMANWDLHGAAELHIPEPVQVADVVILAGGHQGTMRTCNWARIAGKPYLPIARSRGAAEQLYHIERLELDSHKHPSDVFQERFGLLANITKSTDQFANDVIDLADHAVTPTSAFVIMSFREPALLSSFRAFRKACDAFSPPYRCFRVDKEVGFEKITDEILARIANSAFCIVDLTDPRPNVCFELGYAKGMGRHVILTARLGTEIPFDLKDYPIVFYDQPRQLTRDLISRIEVIAERQGRKRIER